MLISLAGPAAGFAFAALIMLLLRATGHEVDVKFGLPYLVAWDFDPLANEAATVAVEFLLEVNIWWGLVNLLPVLPLDGGQFTRKLLIDLRVPDPIVKSLLLSVFVAVGVAIFVFTRRHDIYLTMMFGYLGYNSFATLQAYSGRGGGYGG